MAEPITQTRLRALAAVHPEQGRVLSVFLNLDPAQFGTPAARSSAITSVITAAAHKVEESDGLSHDERMALRDDVERVREVLVDSDVASNGTRAVAVYACGPVDLLEIVRLRRPVDNRVVLGRTRVRRAAGRSRARTSAGSSLLANRRAARLFVGPGDALEETDRIVDDVHSQHDQGGWSQLNYQRSVEKEVADHLVHTAEVAFDALQGSAGWTACWSARPEELLGELKSKLHPYLRERIAGKVQLDVENASLDDVRAAAQEAINAHIRRCEREALDRLVESVGRGGRGAAGLADVLDALNQARVETLLIAESFRAAGRVDARPGCCCPRAPTRASRWRTSSSRRSRRRSSSPPTRSSSATTTTSGRWAASAPC